MQNNEEAGSPPCRNNESNECKGMNGINIFQAIRRHRECSEENKSQREPTKKRQWKVLLFGQAIALCAASTNASSFTLEYSLGVILPIFQMMIMYIILSSYLLFKRIEPERHHQMQSQTNIVASTSLGQVETDTHRLPFTKIRLRIPWWIYLCISILDVEANYMTLLSFQYTSLTSTTLLGSLTVPSTMLISRYMLARIFRSPHYIGVCLCLIGGTMTVWSDLGHSSVLADTGAVSSVPLHSHSYIGDMLAITAAVLYGLGDTVAEYSIKHIDRVEYIGMLGFFGAILTFLQFVVLEWDELMALLFQTALTTQVQVGVTMLWYITSLVLYYITETYFLISSDATLLNLSLQTSSLWALLFSVLADKQPPLPLFYLAVVFVTSGVFVYEVGSTNNNVDRVKEKDSEYEALRARDPQSYDALESYKGIARVL